MNKCFYLIIFIIISVSNPKHCFSGNAKDTSNCIYKFPHRITFKTYFSSSDLTYTLRDKDAKYKPIIILPNSRNSIGASISYKSLGISYSSRLNETPYSERRKGKTTYYDFRLNYFYKTYGFDGYLQHYNGLYLKNPRSFYPNFTNLDMNPQFPNMSITTLGYNITIKKNKCFSYKSVYYQSERQNYSTGSLILMVSNRFSRIKNDSNILPESAKKFMPKFSQCTKGTYYDFAVAPGYTYTFVKNKYFINGSMYAGIGQQYQLYTKNDIVKMGYKIIFKYNLRATAGFNDDFFFYKISYDLDLNTIRVEDSRQNISLGALDFTVGFRIK